MIHMLDGRVITSTPDEAARGLVGARP